MKDKTSKKLRDILEEKEFTIHKPFEQNGQLVYELEWFSPLGEDVIVTIFCDGTDAGFKEDFKEYTLSFDADKHAEMYVSMRGTRGIPNSIRALIDDADAIETHLIETMDALYE